MDWARSLNRLTAGEVMAVDGRSSLGTTGEECNHIVQMVSAWGSANNLVLA